jgi:RNA polymerase sigma-70 factor (ECF subfamily)
VDASDVIQEAHVEVTQRIDDFLTRRPMPFHVWVCKTAHQQMLRLRRQHVEAACRAAGGEQSLPDHLSGVLAARLVGDSPSVQLGRAEAILRVQTAVEQLDDTDREILLLRTFEGLTNVEAAQVLDLDPAAASKRYGRALLRLKAVLTAYESA